MTESKKSDDAPLCKISLITVTCGNRSEQLARLRETLSRQTYRNFEHIVIDHRNHPELQGSLSKARNLGLQVASGDVVAFPDDDAWYGPETLADVMSVLSDATVDGISFRVVNEFGDCSAGGWMSPGRKTITPDVIWHTVVSCSFFVKRKVLYDVRFDERLGVGSGSRFGSGEETDFVLKLLARGARLLYDGTKAVYHPRHSGPYFMRNGWRYGNGCGLVLRRHHFAFCRLLFMVVSQVVRSVQALISLEVGKAAYHLAMALGRICGFFCCQECV